MKDIRAFILFECLTALITAHALLTSVNTPEQTQVFFYATLLVMNWMCLILIRIYYKEQSQLVDYDENLTQQHFVYILLAVIGVFVSCTVISQPWTSSVIHVPTFSTQQPTLSTSAFVMAVLYNFALIANSEETTKIVGHNALYLYLIGTYPQREKEVKAFSILTPIGFWATLHAYVAYVGPLIWQLVFAAFVAGLIIFAVTYKTRSLLAAVIVHGMYNVIVLTAAGLGWITLTVYPIILTIMACFNLALLIFARGGK